MVAVADDGLAATDDSANKSPASIADKSKDTLPSDKNPRHGYRRVAYSSSAVCRPAFGFDSAIIQPRRRQPIVPLFADLELY
jgi:hypothetical protein